MKTKITRNKTLLKANSNYKPKGAHGKKHAIRIAEETRKKQCTKEYAELQKNKQTKFDLKRTEKIAKGWKPKTMQDHYRNLLKGRKWFPDYNKLVKLHKDDAKKRRIQSEKDKAAFKDSVKKFKDTYKPTGNKEDNPAFNGYMPLKGRYAKKQNGMSARKMYRTCKRTKHKVELTVSMNTAA